jgi:poly(A)-specific ribonuclease
MEDELDHAIGFSKVIDAISKSKKPVIGHNALLDFVYVFNQFYKPLPDTLAQFKAELGELFPVIYDTKHVTLRSPLVENMKSTSLSALFEYVREHVKPGPESLLSPDERFDAYRQALKAEADGEQNLLCHEAGFDAFMTAVCFLGLLAHDAEGKLLTDDALVGAAQLDARLKDMETFKNQINLMISDERFLDLANPTQTIDRSRVYRVTSTKRKIHQVRMEDVFQASKIHRVVRESEQEAFVVLEKPVEDDEDVSAASSKNGLAISTYDEFVADRAEKARLAKEQVEREIFERLSAEGATFPALKEANEQKDEAKQEEAGTLWNRCTIS